MMKSPTEIESKGIELAHWCEWNGVSVLEVAQAALTDANFHFEAEIIEQIVNALNEHSYELEYELIIMEKK